METVKEENEKKKEYLKQYGKALRQEKRIEEELERLKLDRMLIMWTMTRTMGTIRSLRTMM